MDGVASRPAVRESAAGDHLRREVPIHALMIVVMGVAMVSHSALASVAGAALLIAVSVVCAALSRSRGFLREHVLDLWAMALVMLVFLPAGPVTGHHAVSVPAAAAYAAVVVSWAVGRGWLALAGRAPWRGVAASGGLTAAGLVVMGLFCA